jgi:hypothetical protein
MSILDTRRVAVRSRGTGGPRPALVQAAGLLLFLFIPLVLFLFVRHPEPIGASLLGGLALMVGHRFLARRYMLRVLPVKCIWCNRLLPATLDGSTRTLDLAAGGQVQPVRCCAEHLAPASRFFAFLQAGRWPLRAGIFLPLVALLAGLAAAALGWPRPLAAVTPWFLVVVGVTVNVAAAGYLLMPAGGSRAPVAVPFPIHNFFLLGVRTLLWVFRLVGLWWIYQGASALWPVA